MQNTVSFNKWFFLAMMTVVIISTAYFSRMHPPKDVDLPTLPLPEEKEDPLPALPAPPIPPIKDEIKEHDRAVISDPLVYPTKRIERSQIPPSEFLRMINISTQGYPDNPRLLGYLTRVEEGETDNRVLELYGRQKYPRSSKFEYYTFLNSGQHRIKLPLEVQHDNELYDNDIVPISQLTGTYTVKLYENETFRYYPNIF